MNPANHPMSVVNRPGKSTQQPIKTSNQPSNLAHMPKIELHCHLDGSMGLEVTRQLLAERGEYYELAQLRQLLEAPKDCNSLAEYLERFDLPIRCLQTK